MRQHDMARRCNEGASGERASVSLGINVGRLCPSQGSRRTSWWNSSGPPGKISTKTTVLLTTLLRHGLFFFYLWGAGYRSPPSPPSGLFLVSFGGQGGRGFSSSTLHSNCRFWTRALLTFERFALGGDSVLRRDWTRGSSDPALSFFTD